MLKSFRSSRKCCAIPNCESISKYYVTTKRTKDTKDWEIFIFNFHFVLFATFVVKYLFRFWLRLCRARIALWLRLILPTA
jgi:hypothetical protein